MNSLAHFTVCVICGNEGCNIMTYFITCYLLKMDICALNSVNFCIRVSVYICFTFLTLAAQTDDLFLHEEKLFISELQ